MGRVKAKLTSILCAAVLAAPAAAATHKLLASDGAADDEFGCSVSASGDTALVGARYDGDRSGSAYVFVRSGTTWTEQAELLPGDGAAGDEFGRSVSVSGDTAVVGAWWDGDNGTGSGSAYVFVRSGSTWTEQVKLTASDGVASDCFGVSVSVSGDTAVAGAYGGDDSGTDSGSAYAFDLSSLRPAGGGGGGCTVSCRRAAAGAGGGAMLLLAATAAAFALGRRTPTGMDCVRDLFGRSPFE